jgi:hypothetical protein
MHMRRMRGVANTTGVATQKLSYTEKGFGFSVGPRADKKEYEMTAEELLDVVKNGEEEYKGGKTKVVGSIKSLLG